MQTRLKKQKQVEVAVLVECCLLFEVKVDLSSQMSRLEHYMTFMKLPPELQLRITNYYQARYGGKWFDAKEVMHTVSSALREVSTISHLLIYPPTYTCRSSTKQLNNFPLDFFSLANPDSDV